MIEAFLGKVGQSILATFFKDGIKKLYAYRHMLFLYGKYKKSLFTTLSQMPFIYKDIDLEVLEDYVDIEVQFVNTDNLSPILVLKNNQSLEKLNQNFKALFIGSAGMGKSTFFRYATLSIISGKIPYFLSSLKDQIPVFVSLKAIPNFGKSPIINAIIKDLPFLKHGGFHKLEKLTGKRKLFFLLDGYDEISFSNSNNSIKYELGLLLSTTIESSINPDLIESKYHKIYENITRCTVWLSTREEFYRLNPIGIRASKENDKIKIFNKEFIAVQLRGLGDNRLVLVKKIFDKYRSRSKMFTDLLDEEIFIEEIDTHQDQELVKLSKRPLFLTILCYIYVNHLLSNKENGRDWILYLNDLVLECIKVLLSDLDKFKVRDYTAEQKKLAFVKRRSNFLEEKIEFLKFFAFEMLKSGENLFNEKTLDKYVRLFFYERYIGEKRAEIINELDAPKSNNPNIVTQLLYSGIFVVVSANSDNLSYDFPHRRFKEVLATEALKDQKTFNDFLSKTHNHNLSEFVLIVFKNYKDKQDVIIKMVFQNWHTEVDQLYNSQLIMNLLLQNPNFQIDTYLITYIKRIVDSNSYNKIYFELLQKGKNSFSIIESMILESIKRYISNNQLHSITTSIELLEIINPKALKRFIRGINLETINAEVKMIFKKFELKNLIKKDILIAATNNDNEISLIALSTISDSQFSDAFYISIFDTMSIKNLLLFWYMLIKNNKHFSLQLKSSVFHKYWVVYSKFIESNTNDAFIRLSLNNLRVSLSELELVKSTGSYRNIYNNDYILKDIKNLEVFIRHIEKFKETDYEEMKNQLKAYDNSNFKYLFDRIDRYKFFDAQNID